MNIIVCIKQVPGTSNVKVDPVTGVLIRDGIENKMNPYDLFALETALKIKEEKGAHITVVTMGPPPAAAVLKEAIYMGTDDGILVSDRNFGGADVLATSYTLSSALLALNSFDLVLTGKQTTDGDTAQVGAELAEFLKIPHFAGVNSIEIGADKLTYTATLDTKVITAQMEMPCLVCVDGEINTPRLPSYKRMLEFGNCDTQIKVLSLNDFSDKDTSHYGLKGSPTQVERIFPPEVNDQKTVFEGDDDRLTENIFSVLTEKKFI